MWAVAFDVWRTRGAFGLFRGVLYIVVCEILLGVVYFVMYEIF